MAKEPHEALVAETIAEGANSPEEVIEGASHKLPGFKRTDVTKGIIADEAHRQLTEDSDPE
jgi:hypothetical protein